MTEPSRTLLPRPTGIVGAWRTFFFRPQAAYPIGLVRIAFGALITGWALSLLPGLDPWFSQDGVNPLPTTPTFEWSVFNVWNSHSTLAFAWAILLIAAIALTVGWHSRLAAFVVFVLVLSFQWRDPWVFNSGDVLIRIEAFYLALSPCGAALSLDQRRRTGKFWSAEMCAPWALRLIQLQVSLIYLSTVQEKLGGHAWPEGTAVSYAMRLQDMLLMPTPDWLTTNPLLMNLATWGTLALELAIGILVWNRRLRPWVLGVGVLMHLSIMITINIGFFSLAMFVAYLAFVPPETAEDLPNMAKRLAAKLSKRRRGVAAGDEEGAESVPTSRTSNGARVDDSSNAPTMTLSGIGAIEPDPKLFHALTNGHRPITPDGPTQVGQTM